MYLQNWVKIGDFAPPYLENGSYTQSEILTWVKGHPKDEKKPQADPNFEGPKTGRF